MTLESILIVAVLFAYALVETHSVVERIQHWRQRRNVETPDDGAALKSGHVIETDCRACGQFNRVPEERLRDRPKCGRCKKPLMPGRRIAVCTVEKIEGRLRNELNRFWNDDDRFWQSLADHVVLERKAQREAADPSIRVSN